MESFTIVLAESDSAVARSLATSLDAQFRSVKTVRSLDELKSAIPRLRAEVVIVDLETISLADVASLLREFPVSVVCMHRVPDEDLWTAAMEVGAVDVCDKSNIPAMVRAITHAHPEARSTAA